VPVLGGGGQEQVDRTADARVAEGVQCMELGGTGGRGHHVSLQHEGPWGCEWGPYLRP
jgi:hypothetical protein